MRTLLLFITFTLTIAMANPSKVEDWPHPNFENCEFYGKLEGLLKCQSVGVDYLSHYAPYYCEAFKRESKGWSKELNMWAQKTGLCLQKMLYGQRDNPNLSCKTLEDIAFSTHAGCYNQADLCKLKIPELFKVIRVIKMKDMMREVRYSASEINGLMMTCLDSWIFGEKN